MNLKFKKILKIILNISWRLFLLFDLLLFSLKTCGKACIGIGFLIGFALNPQNYSLLNAVVVLGITGGILYLLIIKLPNYMGRGLLYAINADYQKILDSEPESKEIIEWAGTIFMSCITIGVGLWLIKNFGSYHG